MATPSIPSLMDGFTSHLLPAPGGATIAAGSAEDTATDAHADRVVVARLDAGGRLDPRFGHGGATAVTLPGIFYFGVAGAGRDAAGRILLLASAAPLNGNAKPDAILIRLLPDGTPDASFGPGGMVTLGHGVSADDLLVDRDGSAVALGAIPGRGARPAHVVVYRLDARGRIRRAIHMALHRRHLSGEVGPTALLRGSNGSVIVAGNDAAGVRTWGWIARLRRDGRWGRRVNPAGKDRRFHISALARDRRGRVVAAGWIDELDPFDAAAVRLRADGRVDRRFGVVQLRLGAGALPHVNMMASIATAAAVDRRGRIVLAGTAYDDDIPEKEDFGDPYFAAVRLKGRP
jgi:uncharacterized delta-60 repeat protein